MAPILGPDGKPLNGRGWYDTEALAVEDGVAYVGIERVNQIVRFDIAKDGLRARGRPMAVPPGMKLLPRNQSIECVEMAPKGSPLAGTLISISERGLDSHGNLMGFLIGGRSRGGAVLAEAHRRFRRQRLRGDAGRPAPGAGAPLLMGAAVSRSASAAWRSQAIKPGALVDGPELIFADMGSQIDNMEGLSVHRDKSGATGADADLRRQFLAAAANAAASVHAGRGT